MEGCNYKLASFLVETMEKVMSLRNITGKNQTWGKLVDKIALMPSVFQFFLQPKSSLIGFFFFLM